MSFPEKFVWGAAAASYQIEGAVHDDGRGQSVWDALCRKPGAILRGDTGEVACDHYHRYAQDVKLMAEIGLQAYRLSISWPRVMPEGDGPVSEAGLSFYDRLVDELLGAGVQPWVTLFHWDFPLDLYHRGGWLNPKSPQWFADYTTAVVERLSDRVEHWFTLNEPQCFINLGHAQGIHAPGVKLPLQQELLAAHHALMAHGRAVQAIRAAAKKTPQVGCAPVGSVCYPVEETPQCIEAAYRASMSVAAMGTFNNTWFSDPALLGHYPEDGLRKFDQHLPDAVRHAEADLDIIRQPLDFFGVNIYQGSPVSVDEDGQPVHDVLPGDYPRTLIDWPVTPEALRWGPRFLHRRYGLPIVITENGLSNPDWVSLDGKCHDPQRIDFTQRYLLALEQAGEDGVDLAGYFHWSIMDNFEWAEGYRHRFGLIHVDYKTQKRTLKDSAYWYKQVIESHGASLAQTTAG